MGSRISTISNMQLHLLVWKKTFLYNFVYNTDQHGHALKNNSQSWNFIVKGKNLVTTEKQQYRKSHLLQINLL